MERDREIDIEIMAYLLGEMELSEAQAFESKMNADPDLKLLVRETEEVLEKLAFENAVNPPPAVLQTLGKSVEETMVYPLDNRRPRNYQLYFRVAASVALLFGITLFWLLTEWNSSKEELESLSGRSVTMENRIEELEQELQLSESRYQEINSPEVTPLLLTGNDKLPNAKAVAYVNHEEKKVYLNTLGLPELDAEHDYQMWADVDGEMIDMGVIRLKNDLLAMTYIPKAESLNITIEPKGGSEHPTVSNLIANVYL